jgi:hypothetical protein
MRYCPMSNSRPDCVMRTCFRLIRKIHRHDKRNRAQDQAEGALAL